MSLYEKQRKQFTIIEHTTTPGFPDQLSVEPTNVCNHKCLFCANPKITKPKTFIDKSLAIRAFQDAFENGARDLSLSATGEPLIYPELDVLIHEAKKIGFPYVYINTNGMLATEDRVYQLMDAGLDSIKFSINAGARESYHKVHGLDVFDKVIANIQNLYDIKLKNNFETKIYVSFVALPEVEAEYDLLNDKIGYILDDEIHFRKCSNQAGNMPENSKRASIEPGNILGSRNENTKATMCSQLFNRIVLNAQGLITACCNDYQNSLIIADYNKFSLMDAWLSSNLRFLRQKHLEGDLTGLICQNCIYNTSYDFSPVSAEYFSPFEES